MSQEPQMNFRIRGLVCCALILSSGPVSAATWVEPEDPEALAQAEVVVTASVVQSHPLAARFKIEQIVAGQHGTLATGQEFPVSGYYTLNLGSISGGFDHEIWRFDDYKPGSTYVLYLKEGRFSGDMEHVKGIINAGETVYQLPTPTLCRVTLKDGIAQSGHLWTSFYGGSMPGSDYLACLTSIWKVVHGQEADPGLTQKALARLKVLPVDSKEEPEVGEQAMWLSYLAVVGKAPHLETVLPFISSPYGGVRMHAVKALGRLEGPQAAEHLLKIVNDPQAAAVLKTFAIQALSARGAKDELLGLQALLPELSDEPIWFARNLMDPRISTTAPSPKQALTIALKQLGVTPPETPTVSAERPVPKEGESQTPKTVVRCDFGGELVKEHWGPYLDEVGDVASGGPGHLDLYRVQLRGVEDEDEVTLELSTVGAFPPAGRVDAAYRLLFDADNNAETGVVVEGVAGIEREIRIDVKRGELLSDLLFVGSIIDHTSSKTVPFTVLPDLPPEALGRLATMLTLQPFAVDATVPRDALALSAPQVPVTAMTVKGAEAVIDTGTFIFDRRYWEKLPTLALSSATVGEPMRFAIRGLTAGRSFTIKVEETSVLTDTVGNDGTFNGSFVLPAVSTGNKFVNAQDETGAYAFNTTECTDYHPGSLVAQDTLPEQAAGEAYGLYMSGLAKLNAERYDEAIAFFEGAYHLDPDNPRVARRLVRAYSLASRSKDAITVLERLIGKLAEPSDEELNLLAQLQGASGFIGLVQVRQANNAREGSVAGAELVFTSEDGKFQKRTKSNDRGRYLILVPQGRYDVVASHPDYETYTSRPGFHVLRQARLQTADVALMVRGGLQCPQSGVFPPSGAREMSSQQANAAPRVSINSSQRQVTSGTPFVVTVTGEDDGGLIGIWWWSEGTDEATLAKAHWHDCAGAKTCSRSWDVSTEVAGALVLLADAREIAESVSQAQQASDGWGTACVNVLIEEPKN